MLEALEFVNIAGPFRIHAKKSRTGGARTRPGWPDREPDPSVAMFRRIDM